MITHLEAVQALLEPLDRPVHLIEVPPGTITYPYYLVWPSTGAPGLEVALAGSGDESFLIGVTSVGENPTAAGQVAQPAKQLLGPRKFVPLTVPGRRAWIKWEGFASADVDRAVTLPDANRHPAFEAHLYRVESIPV